MHEALYRSLYRIRRVEEEVARVYPTDVVKSPIHLSTGQEAIAVGVCAALRSDDVVFGTYRGHALYLAKGGDLDRMAAELFGKATGCAKGKGGSMHLIDVGRGVMGTSAVVATTIPHAVGYAYALKLRRADAIVVSFFGDGAVEEGAFHESLNFASLKRLPLLLVCENNGYAVHSPLAARQPAIPIADRARAYGLPSERLERDDVLEIYDRACIHVTAVRAGEGPRLLECLTYRWKEHVGPNDDFDAGYRSRAGAEPWLAGDQVPRLGALLTPDQRRAIEDAVDAEIRDAFAAADRSPFPVDDDLFTDVVKERPPSP